MSNRLPASKLDQYFIHTRLLSSGHLKKTEISAAKSFLYRLFLVPAEMVSPGSNQAEIIDSASNLSHQEIQARLVQVMGLSALKTPEQESDAALAECCLRCFASHSIALVCLELERRFQSQFGFRAVDVLPYVLSDTDPRKPHKDQKFQVPLAIHVVHSFDPNKGNLTAWTKLLTLQHRELNRILAEYGIHRRTDWSILNSYTPVRVKRLLSGVLTESELQSMCCVLESYHTVYRQARRQTRQAGKPCKEPDQQQLQAMVWDLEQRGFEGYSIEQVMQTLRLLALKLRHKPPESGKEQELHPYQPHTAEEREQELFVQYQQELLSECLKQAIKQVLDAHLNRLRQKKAQTNAQTLPQDQTQDQIFLEAMRLFYCEGKSMSEIAPRIGHQKEYQVSRLLDLKTLREEVRQPWHNLACARIARLLNAYFDPTQLPQQRQKIEHLIALQIEQIINEDRINVYRRQRISHTLFAESLRCYLEGGKAFGS